MTCCDKCRHWLRNNENHGQCVRHRWITAAWYNDCDSYQAPAPVLVVVPEPEEPTSVLLERYRAEGLKR